MSNPSHIHESVMPTEALELLQVKSGEHYLDATFGRGGHTRRILAAGGIVTAVDVDPEAIEFGKQEFAQEIAAGKLTLVAGNFAKLAELLPAAAKFAGILFDFGTSTDQLTSGSRGFSFNETGPLDMRMDPELQVTALDLLTVLHERQLADIFREYGGERQSKFMAKIIKKNLDQIKTTTGLAKLIESAKKREHSKLHPATKVFQALRIAVNDELGSIEQALEAVPQFTQHGTRIVTISFHEGEDRLAKRYMKQWQAAGLGETVTKKPMTPSEEEVRTNSRARSAKTRGFACITEN